MTNIKHPDPITYYLPAVGTWPASHYLLDGRCQDAIQLAQASGRPLLVRGLPGTGKSDLARAAAEFLQRAFVYEVVTARSEPQDLLWRFDAVARLADAQAQQKERAQDIRHYIVPGALWWAIDWQRAEQWQNDFKVHAQRPDAKLQDQKSQAIDQQQRAQTKGCVLLLDEIDKADSELPNSLLEVLANSGFRLPCAEAYEIKASQCKPLIIITTNEDRELPAAFIRRCLVLPLAAGDDFQLWIKDRARSHYRDPELEPDDDGRPAMAQAILDQAAKILMEDRQQLRGEAHLPGLAEYLDLLRGLHQLAPDDPHTQQVWLERICAFAYRKSASLTG
ncbi:AAA family ATPase [Methylomonas sp. 11b]|uniref:AAA family ATPase n=1 Tax=Methylomonas sp. 11b TaxID=1168169 RepID=UPI00047913AE|nr:MoxR family ATPase [Methylomonas sp. 11b]